ncbi:hypothetical protein ACJJIE_13300 [Microbulbifer sp. TRSA001]|uniref:ParE family toxin-like protein n=1 Tax=Microbulbifer sp. TRSA001 TaxID=3243381 RepID=UPI00403A4336
MHSLQAILTKCPHQIHDCHRLQAITLHQQLSEGIPFTLLGGKRIKQSPQIIRFKIGRDWRLLYREQANSLTPYCLISRQCFNQVIQRR